MQIMVYKNYLGRDENKNPIIDWERSGRHVMGIHASIKSTCVSVVKVYQDAVRWDVIEEFVVHEPDIDSCLLNANKFIRQYRIENVFGNSIGASIAKLQNRFSLSDKQQIEGYEVIKDVEPEHLMFLVQGNLKKIKFKQHLSEVWHKELKTFDLRKLQDNTYQCPRLFSLACVIKGARPYTSFFTIGDVPDVIIDSKTGKIVQDNTWKKGFFSIYE